MSKKLKLSKAQAEIVRLMRDEGWLLRCNTYRGVWLRKAKLCWGEKWQTQCRGIRQATLDALENKGYVQRCPLQKIFGLIIYELTKGDSDGSKS